MIENDNSRTREKKVARILYICIAIAVIVAALFFNGAKEEIKESALKDRPVEVSR